MDKSTSEVAHDWFWGLSDAERCHVAALAALHAGCSKEDIVYAVSKPWKWIEEAWEYHSDPATV